METMIEEINDLKGEFCLNHPMDRKDVNGLIEMRWMMYGPNPACLGCENVDDCRVADVPGLDFKCFKYQKGGVNDERESVS